jgi:predicted site-specific integrase-resolvase
MTSQEVCEYLGITINNLYQIRFRGHVKVTNKEGKRSFYAREDVEAYKVKRDARAK